jgi:hypothetical protein
MHEGPGGGHNIKILRLMAAKIPEEVRSAALEVLRKHIDYLSASFETNAVGCLPWPGCVLQFSTEWPLNAPPGNVARGFLSFMRCSTTDRAQEMMKFFKKLEIEGKINQTLFLSFLVNVGIKCVCELLFKEILFFSH